MISLVLVAETVFPVEQSPNKNQYTFYNPTPEKYQRDLSADRPDTTESPYTVDAGAVQLEMSFLDFSRKDKTNTYTITPFNLKVGLNNYMDIQFVFSPYVFSGSVNGVGDSQIRLKINLWGNDKGRTAFGVMPFVKFPTARDNIGNGKLETGLILPFAMELTKLINMGLMLQGNYTYDDSNKKYNTEMLHSITFGISLIKWLGMYIEYVGVSKSDSTSSYGMLLSGGLTFKLTDNFLLDAGTKIGLKGDVDDLNFFVGMTYRL